MQRHATRFSLPVIVAAFCLSTLVTTARADDIPLDILRYWNSYNTAGWNYLNRGQYDKAEDRFRRAIEEIRPYCKKDMRLLARSYADLSRVFYHQGRHAEAEPLAAWALSVREAHPNANRDDVFQSLYTLALIHSAQDHFNKAESFLRRALEIQENEIGPNHVQTAATIDELAGVCSEQRKFHDAEILYRRAIAIYERFKPEENLDLAGCADRYGAMLNRMGRKEEAEKYVAQAKKIREAVETRTANARDTRTAPGFKGFK